jgi:hypothetical protein
MASLMEELEREKAGEDAAAEELPRRKGKR